MVCLLERAIASMDRRFVLLAPPDAPVPHRLRQTTVNDPSAHQALVREVQKLRGRVYLADGAIQPEQLASDGRHYSFDDDRSWHLVTLGPDGRPNGCMRVRHHEPPVGLPQLRARRTPLADDPGWRDALRRAIDADSRQAQRERLQYVEVGGWAVSEETRRTPDGILLALAVFALCQHLGGCLAITTATARHASATILRRLGGAPFEYDGQRLPSYYDPHYRCEMELLRFDSRRPGTRYADAVSQIEEHMAFARVLESSTAHTADMLVPVPALRRASAVAGFAA